MYATYVNPLTLLRPPATPSTTVGDAVADTTAPRQPRVYGSPSEYRALLRRMQIVGMIDFTVTPEAVNGVFCVPKGDDLRLIIDAQVANDCFIPAPTVRLPNPSHFSQLAVSAQDECYMSKYDLKDFYHRLEMPVALRPWFALPPIRAGDIGLDLTNSAFDADTLVYPMCTTLPMGWSHSVFIAQSVHEHVLYTSRVLAPEDNILNLFSPHIDRPIHGVYIDDLGIVSTNLHRHLHLHAVIIDAYEKVGLPVKMSKVVAPTSLRLLPVELLGMTFGWDSERSHVTIAVAPAKILALINTTLRVLTIGSATGTEISKLVGSWSWAILLRRPAFAVFQHVFRFAIVAHRERYQIWPSVRRELLHIIALAPLLRSSMTAPFSTRFVASDASSTGGGVMSTDMTPQLRDIFWPMYYSKQSVSPVGLEALPLTSTFDPAAHQPSRVATQQWYRSTSPYAIIDRIHWSTIISTQWKYEEHINVLELRALLLEIQWVISLPSSCSTRLFALLDSAVAFYAVRKGRSSSPTILNIIRKINSLLLAADISLLPIWVPSAVNPADAPSRA